MGPNLHFLATMRECRGYRFTQLMETDCVPAKADWLTELDAICRGERFWIAGAFLHELGSVSPNFAAHINGNALSATVNPAFQAFLEETFILALRPMIVNRGDIDLAYDFLAIVRSTFRVRVCLFVFFSFCADFSKILILK